MPKPTILTFVHWYWPGYKGGGPIRTILNMVDVLGDDLEFRIVTSDRDLKDKAPYAGIAADSWQRVGKARVHYTSSGKQGILNWAHLIQNTPHDVVYLNSLFDLAFTFRPLLACKLMEATKNPIIIAPRGELSPGAISLKRWKKVPFLQIAKRLGLYRNIVWQATTEDEGELIRRQFGVNVKVAVAGNLPRTIVDLPPRSDAGVPRGPLRIAFLSRISRNKNLDYALRVLSGARSAIQFDIWGPLEDPVYWEECQTFMEVLRANVKVQYCGLAKPTNVIGILSNYDLLFLPTRGENYGHVIAEAFSAGTPVLISDTTPWRNLQAEGVGWDLPLDAGEHTFVKVIEESGQMIPANREVWRKRVQDFAQKRLYDPNLVSANFGLFLRASGRPCRLRTKPPH